MSPITSGSVALRRFYVEGEVTPDWETAYESELRRWAFRPVRAERGETSSVGWVNPRQVLDSDVTMDKVRVGRGLILALRQDKLSLNPRLFKARRDLALAEAAAKAKKTRLSKNERRVVEEQVRLEMLRGQTPATRIVEGYWRPDRGLVFVGESSESAALLFAGLFSSTFGLSLVPASAGLESLRWAEREGLEERLASLEPAFFGGGALFFLGGGSGFLNEEGERRDGAS